MPPTRLRMHTAKRNAPGKRGSGKRASHARPREQLPPSGQQLTGHQLTEEAARPLRPSALVFIYSKGQSTPSPWKQPTKAVGRAVRTLAALSEVAGAK